MPTLQTAIYPVEYGTIRKPIDFRIVVCIFIKVSLQPQLFYGSGSFGGSFVGQIAGNGFGDHITFCIHNSGSIHTGVGHIRGIALGGGAVGADQAGAAADPKRLQERHLAVSGGNRLLSADRCGKKVNKTAPQGILW